MWAAEGQPGPKSPALTVAVVASADPAAKALFGALHAHPWFVANAGRVQLLEVSADVKPAGRGAGSAGVSVGVYRHGPRGLEKLAGRSGFAGANEVAKWASEFDATAGAPTPPAPSRDPYLARTQAERPYAAPSQQGYSVPASVPALAPASVPASPPGFMPAAVPASVQPAMTMMMAPAAMAPTNVIQAPAQHIVVQQSQPQIYFAQQASAPAMVPQAVAPASAAPSNIFMPAAMAPASMPMAMAPASAPQMMMAAPASSPPMMMVAPASSPPMMMMAAPASAPPMMAVASGTQAVATGPVISGAALATQSVSVPASSSRSRVRVRGPGPFASAAARFGERLTTLGRTRIETIQETNLETQLSQSPPGQLVTLTSTSASPVLTPQNNVSVPASIPASPTVPTPQSMAPSPQGPQPSLQAVDKGHHWHR